MVLTTSSTDPVPDPEKAKRPGTPSAPKKISKGGSLPGNPKGTGAGQGRPTSTPRYTGKGRGR